MALLNRLSGQAVQAEARPDPHTEPGNIITERQLLCERTRVDEARMRARLNELEQQVLLRERHAGKRAVH